MTVTLRSVSAALLALLASGLWGAADFLGGTLARRYAAASVVFASQAAGLVVLVLLTPFVRVESGAFGWGALVGTVGTVALAAFYRALADGRMSVVAPVAASGVAVPVLAGLAGGERPSAIALAGIAVTATGIVLASGPELRGGYGSRRSILLAGVAALGFGGVLVFLDRGSEIDVFSTLLAGRFVATVLPALAGPERPATRDLPQLALIGALDLGAVTLYGIATRTSLVAVAAVLASLYPVVTVLLARRMHGERLTRVQLAGVVAALTGVVALASS